MIINFITKESELIVKVENKRVKHYTLDKDLITFVDYKDEKYSVKLPDCDTEWEFLDDNDEVDDGFLYILFRKVK